MVDQLRAALDEPADGPIAFAVVLVVLEIGLVVGVRQYPPLGAFRGQVAWIDLREGVENEPPVIRREVAYFE